MGRDANIEDGVGRIGAGGHQPLKLGGKLRPARLPKRMQRGGGGPAHAADEVAVAQLQKAPLSPTAAWIWRQLLEATPIGRQPRFLIHDRDAVYGGDFDQRLTKLGIAGVRSPSRAPTANAIGERIVHIIRTERLDHLMVINERHLQAVLAEFADYYNRDRPHCSLGLQSPIPAAAQSSGRVISRSVLGGLHHAYARAA